MSNSPQIDGGGGDDVGKRPMDIDEDGVSEAKKRKVNGEEEMKRVAELVLVLSAMGMMRGGREPTMAEIEMMAEARKKVVNLCDGFSPKDVVPREAFCGVIDDLGFNRLKDQRLGFRSSKLPISDKIALTKSRMEESEALAAQPAPYPSQQLQTGSKTASEIRGTPPPVRVLSSDKVGRVSSSTGTFQPSTSVIHSPTVVQTTPVVQTPPSVIHVSTIASTPLAASAPVTRNAGKDSNFVVPSRTDRAHIRPDGRLNVQSSVPHVPANSPANRVTVRTTPVHLQPQPPSQINIGPKNKAPDQLPVMIGITSGPQRTPQPAVGQTPKPSVNQTAPGTIPTMHHPVKGVEHAHPPVVNHHVEISKAVQRLLNPNLPQRPTWSAPSRDYMNKAHPCQFCKLIINEVETVVICDACEKAFHLGCLQSHNVKGIPRGEWHCPRCVAMSHGKPFPPKYGRVTRNMNAPKGPSNTSVAHFPSEKKMESANENATQLTTNGNVNVRTQSQSVNAAEQSCGSTLSHGIDTGRMVTSVGKKNEVKTNMESGPKNQEGFAMDTSLSSSSVNSSQQAVKSEVSHPEDGFISETKSSTPVIAQANSTLKNLPSSSNQNDVDQKVSNCAESLLFRHSDSNGVVQCNQSYNEEICEKDGLKPVLVVADRVQDQAREVIETSKSELHNVDWIGEIDKVIDGKKLFRSCCINGVVYHVQNYALFCSSTGKLTPLRLQGMWEDSQTSSKWLLIHKCYFPEDLPGEVGRPGAPQINEVYESTHDSSMMAGSVQGPCEVLPFRKFGEEADISNPASQGNEKMGPVFIRNWFYDESKRAFCPSAS